MHWYGWWCLRLRAARLVASGGARPSPIMSGTNFLAKGLAKIKEATLADQAGNVEQAIELYMHGLEQLAVARKRAPLAVCLPGLP